MILTHDLIAEELLTTFKVIKVHYEPYAESIWTLQFEDGKPIDYFDKCFRTREEDRKLIDRTIRAQIDLQVDYEDTQLIINPEEQIQAFYTDNNDDYCFATGIYFEDSQEVDPKFSNPNRIKSCFNSLFKMRIMSNLGGDPLNFKKGDWLKMKTSERNIIIDRKYLLVD